MAKIKKIIENGGIQYPATITDAVKNPNNGKTVTEELSELGSEVKNLDNKKATKAELQAEVTRATNAENALSNKIEAETTRATAAELELRKSISNETIRAKEAEEELENSINANRYGYNVTVNGLKGGVHRIETAVKDVPSKFRMLGQKITFRTENGDWATYHNESLSLDNYENVNDWVQEIGISSVQGDVNITNAPDYEDLTEAKDGTIKFADKEYSAESFSGLGRVYLRKNIVEGIRHSVTIQVTSAPLYDGTLSITLNSVMYNIELVAETHNTISLVAEQIAKIADSRYNVSLDGSTITFVAKVLGEGLSTNVESASGVGLDVSDMNDTVQINQLVQDMFVKPNTIYIIQYDYDLQGEEITIPEGCVLDFQGGSLNYGTLIGGNTKIKADLYTKLFIDVKLTGKWSVSKYSICWFGAELSEYRNLNKRIDCSAIINNIIGMDCTQTLYVPAGAWYIEHPIIISKPTTMILEGFIGAGVISQPDINISNTALLFTDRNINVIEYKVDSAGFLNIVGGGISTAFCGNYEKVIINLVCDNCSIKDSVIKTSLVGQYNNRRNENNNCGIFISPINGGSCSNIHIDLNCLYLHYGVKAVGLKTNENWITDLFIKGNISAITPVVIDTVTHVNIEGSIGGGKDNYDKYENDKGLVCLKGNVRLCTISSSFWGRNYSYPETGLSQARWAITIEDSVDEVVLTGMAENETFINVDKPYKTYNFRKYLPQSESEPFLINDTFQIKRTGLNYSDLYNCLIADDSFFSYKITVENGTINNQDNIFDPTKTEHCSIIPNTEECNITVELNFVEPQFIPFIIIEHNGGIDSMTATEFDANDVAKASYSLKTGRVIPSTDLWYFYDYLLCGTYTEKISKIVIKGHINSTKTCRIKSIKSVARNYKPSYISKIGGILDGGIKRSNGSILIHGKDSAVSANGDLENFNFCPGAISAVKPRGTTHLCLLGATYDNEGNVFYGRIKLDPWDYNPFGTSANRPTEYINNNRPVFYWDVNLMKPIWYIGDETDRKWRDANGNPADAKSSGTFSEKPSTKDLGNIPIGFGFFCTDRQTVEGGTDGIMIYHKGNNVWVDALGRVVK